jgi:drug/metabolite transporter (DMT)-like permease
MSLSRLAVATAPVVFVLLWSTGFIGARYGLPYIEPLTFLAVRMFFVVLIIAAIAIIGAAKPALMQARSATVLLQVRWSTACISAGSSQPSARACRRGYQH